VNPAKTYTIPPATIKVVSENGGSATTPVVTLIPSINPVSGVTVVADKSSPQLTGTTIVFSASATGGTGSYEYRFQLHDGAVWSQVQNYSPTNSWAWVNPSPGTYTLAVTARNAGAVDDVGSATTQLIYTISPLPAPATGATIAATPASPKPVGTSVIFSATGSGGSGTYEYEFQMHNGTSWSIVQSYTSASNWVWNSAAATPGNYTVQVSVRSAGSTAAFEATAATAFSLTPVVSPPAPATGATLTASPTAPQPVGTSVVFTAGGVGGSGTYEYEFNVHNGTSWTKVQNFSTVNSWVWNTTGAATGSYTIQVNVRSAGSTAAFEGFVTTGYTLTPAVVAPAPATGATISATPASPQPAGTPFVVFSAAGSGGSGTYEYEFWVHNGVSWSKVQSYSSTANFAWNTSALATGVYTIQVNVRSAGSSAAFEAVGTTNFEIQ
jgi:P2-related tail formation protein